MCKDAYLYPNVNSLAQKGWRAVFVTCDEDISLVYLCLAKDEERLVEACRKGISERNWNLEWDTERSYADVNGDYINEYIHELGIKEELYFGCDCMSDDVDDVDTWSDFVAALADAHLFRYQVDEYADVSEFDYDDVEQYL